MSRLVTFLPPEIEHRYNQLSAELNTLWDTAKNQPTKMLTRSESKRVDAIIAEISMLKQMAKQSDEFRAAKIEGVSLEMAREKYAREAEHRALFRDFLRGGDIEHRAQTFQAGTNAVTYTAGSQGGILVPVGFNDAVVEGMAATDPLLRDDVSTVITEPDFSLRPMTIPGWDLSQIAAVNIQETLGTKPGVCPQVSAKLTSKYTYRLSLSASLEWEEDEVAYGSAIAAMGRAYGIGFARGIGADLTTGTGGGNGPAGILNGLTSVYTTANANKITYTDITSVYFSINAIHRQAPKAAWLMTDPVYQMVRNAVDNQGRPLIQVEGDNMLLLGKRVLISPSLPSSVFTVFGDLSHYHVHRSTMFLRRSLQASGYVEYGMALYQGLLMCDGVLHDPSASGAPSVVVASLA